MFFVHPVSNALFMKNILLFLSFLVLLTSCTQKFTFRKLSEYTIRQDALENHAPVEIIQSSGGPDLNKERSYYYQYLTVHEVSRDTFRVLSVNYYDTEIFSRHKHFLSSASADPMDKLIRLLAEQLQHDGSQPPVHNVNEIGELSDASADKVSCNREYTYWERRDYPVVIGHFVDIEIKDSLTQNE